METQEEPTLKTRYLGRRVYSLYILKRKDKLSEASQITVLGHALFDQVKSGRAESDKEARENMVRLLCKEDLRTAPLDTFVDIPLSLAPNDFFYVDRPMRTYTQKIMTRPMMHHAIGESFDELLQFYGDVKNIPKNFNCLAIVEQRDASASKIGLIKLSDGKPLERRVDFAGNFAIYRVQLKVPGSIVDYFKELNRIEC